MDRHTIHGSPTSSSFGFADERSNSPGVIVWGSDVQGLAWGRFMGKDLEAKFGVVVEDVE